MRRHRGNEARLACKIRTPLLQRLLVGTILLVRSLLIFMPLVQLLIMRLKLAINSFILLFANKSIDSLVPNNLPSRRPPPPAAKPQDGFAHSPNHR